MYATNGPGNYRPDQNGYQNYQNGKIEKRGLVSRGDGDSQQDNSLQLAIITSAWPRRGFEIIHFTNKHELLRFRSYEVMFNFELF